MTWLSYLTEGGGGGANFNDTKKERSSLIILVPCMSALMITLQNTELNKCYSNSLFHVCILHKQYSLNLNLNI
jgi:hypothetical protein